MRHTTIKLILTLFFAPFFLSACVSSPDQSKPPATPAPNPATPLATQGQTTGGGSQFYRENIDSIVTRTLSNGIPLIVKKNPSNKIFALKVIVRGTSINTPTGKEGIELLTLGTMARGSKSYSYDALQALAYKTSSSIGGVASNFDYSEFNLVTLDKYFDATFEAFADCFVNPSFKPEDFDVAIKALRSARSQTKADPYSYATSLLHQITFKGHAYARDPQGLDYSLASLSLDDVSAYYRDKLGADRLAIVAVGNFDFDSLYQKVNASFGKLPVKASAKSFDPGIATIKKGLTLEAFPDSPGMAYVRGDFNVPAISDPDYTAYALSASILNDLLYDVVRTKYGACYTPMANGYGYRSPYGAIIIFKTSKPAEIKRYIDEAVKLLADGKTPNLAKQEGAEYGSLPATLSAYKAKYVNGFFSNQETNLEIAGQLAASYVRYGDPSEYLKLIDKVNAVSAQDIERVTKKYLVNGETSWIVISDQATIDKVNKADWLTFTAR
jgi:zinc protease